jgi:low affinity Fe/Cu permease
MASPKRLKTIFKPLVIVVAAVYFVIDALALSVLKPLLRKIANLRLFAFIARWIASLSPYATLALFLIPLILLEPVKPLSAYLVASGQFKLGMLVLVVGEILKITIVERIFHIGRDKLLRIKAFALVYNFVWGWLTWIQALPSWQAVKHSFAGFIHWARKLNHDARARGFQ